MTNKSWNEKFLELLEDWYINSIGSELPANYKDKSWSEKTVFIVDALAAR